MKANNNLNTFVLRDIIVKKSENNFKLKFKYSFLNMNKWNEFNKSECIFTIYNVISKD